jgi:hypothetical protein
MERFLHPIALAHMRVHVSDSNGVQVNRAIQVWLAAAQQAFVAHRTFALLAKCSGNFACVHICGNK